MNFSWFATAFDTDDWLYRIFAFVQLAGVLVLASGIEPMFADGDATALILAHVVMRLSLVAQRPHASARVPHHRARAPPSVRCTSPRTPRL